jgi:hypothetical protein
MSSEEMTNVQEKLEKGVKLLIQCQQEPVKTQVCVQSAEYLIKIKKGYM